MVCHSVRLFAIAITSGIVVSGLRDISESAGEGNVASSDRLTKDLMQTVQDAIGNHEGRGEKMGDAIAILETYRSQGKNASQYLTEDDKQTMQEVLELINESIFGEMYQEHDRDRGLINQSTQPKLTCDSNLVVQNTTGDVGTARETAGKRDSTHISCRQEEDALFQIFMKNNKSVNDYIEAWTKEGVGRAPPELTSRLEDDLNVFFDKLPAGGGVAVGPAWYAWFYDQKEDWEAIYKAWKIAYDNHQAKKKECNSKQLSFEAQHCMLYRNQVDSCDQYDNCYADAKVAHNNTQTLVTAGIIRRKYAYQKGMVVLDLITCFIGKGCQNQTAGNFKDDQFNITFIDLPEAIVCSPDYDDLPCDQTFRQRWYNLQRLPQDAPANHIKHCSQCPDLNYKERPNCRSTAPDGETDESFKTCDYYADNSLACRRLEKSSWPATYCCACGGGNETGNSTAPDIMG